MSPARVHLDGQTNNQPCALKRAISCCVVGRGGVKYKDNVAQLVVGQEEAPVHELEDLLVLLYR